MRGGRYVVRVQDLRPIPDEIPRLAAGVVRSLRDSLDELAAALAGKPTRFPIFESLALFAQRARKAIASMTDEAQAFLEELQPYHTIGGYGNGPLWILQQLDVADPPSRVAACVRDGAMGVNTQRDVSVVSDVHFAAGPVADGDIVAWVSTRIAGSDPKLDMFLQVDLGLTYANQSLGKNREVTALLAELCDHVEHTVFGALEPTLASGR